MKKYLKKAKIEKLFFNHSYLLLNPLNLSIPRLKTRILLIRFYVSTKILHVAINRQHYLGTLPDVLIAVPNSTFRHYYYPKDFPKISCTNFFNIHFKFHPSFITTIYLLCLLLKYLKY